MIALLAGETLEVVYVVPRPHDHLEGGYDLGARRAVACGAEEPGVWAAGWGVGGEISLSWIMEEDGGGGHVNKRRLYFRRRMDDW